MIPGRVGHRVNTWCILWHVADLTHDGRSSFEVESQTSTHFVAYGATFDHGSDKFNLNKIGI